MILLVIDDLSARPVANAGLLAAAERSLDSLASTDAVGLATTSGYGPLIAPSTDRTALRAALRSRELAGRNDSRSDPFYITVREAIAFAEGDRRIVSGMHARECPPTEATIGNCGGLLSGAARRLAAESDRRRNGQLRAYLALLDFLRAFPEPKIAVVIGQGLAIDGSSHGEQIEQIGRVASANGVRFYSITEMGSPVDLQDRGSGKCLPPGCTDSYRARREDGDFLFGGMQILAHAAGGQGFRVIGQADAVLTRVLTETSGIYMIAVGVSGGHEASSQSLRVTTRRRGVTLRVSRHIPPVVK